MSPLSGYSALFPTDLLKNPAVLYVGAGGLGVTRGGVNWDPGTTWENTGFDGKRVPVKGLDRKTQIMCKLSGMLLQFGSFAGMGQLEPGAVSGNPGAPVTEVSTPLDAGVYLVAGNYLTDLRAVWERGNQTEYIAILLPIALCTKYDIKGGPDGEGEISFEFEGRIDLATGQIGDAPYRYERRSALP